MVSTSELLRRVSVGGAHACGLTAQGSALCWGWNAYGQAGTGVSGNEETIPKAVSGARQYRRLAHGRYHACGLAVSGEVYCWGENSRGQLGTGVPGNTNVPTLIAGGRRYRDIAATDEASCAVEDTGDVYCWGTWTRSGTPQLAFEGSGLASLSMSSTHACGVDGAGVAYCWGDNRFGQLGSGNATSTSELVAVSGGHTFAEIDAGYFFTCGLTDSGRAFCWGTNQSLQLGTGSTSPAAVPTPTAVAGGADFTELSAGGHFVCGRLTSGYFRCWGANNAGQLGNGSYTYSAQPVAVAGERKFLKIFGGMSSTCGMAADSTLFCWGDNRNGAAGAGTTVGEYTTPVPVVGGRRYRTVSVGSSYACAVDFADDAWCWGDNASGALGRGSNAAANAPVAVSGGIKFRQIATSQSGGFNHTCALTAAGVAYCWGENSQGQLGDNTQVNRNTPLAVTTTLRFTQIAAAVGFTCALSAAGDAYCWGRGQLGSLGTGDGTRRLVPWPVVGGRKFVAITAADEHACALEADGTAWCWGQNGNGELGDGTAVSTATPVRVAGGVKFSAIFAGGGFVSANATGFTCGLTSGGMLLCWGLNGAGQLMTGTTTGHLTPVQVRGPTRYSTLSTFTAGVCAMGLDGEAYCWGGGSFGDGTNNFGPFLLPKRMYY
ncbi:MAG: RCC1 repeat-containing protein [Gemmatimonadetes bacterium]|nr:RCC1 repeat-containing protein [Gemmatimonadota bacterium]